MIDCDELKNGCGFVWFGQIQSVTRLEVGKKCKFSGKFWVDDTEESWFDSVNSNLKFETA